MAASQAIIPTQVIQEINNLGEPHRALVRDFVLNSVTANGGLLIPPVEVSEFGDVCFQIQGTWVGTFTFQGSFDATNWSNLIAQPVGSATGVTSCTANGAWNLPLSMKFFQVVATAWTSGTATGYARFRVNGVIFRSV